MNKSIGSFGRNAALVAAVLGWLFDGFEMGLFPLKDRTVNGTSATVSRSVSRDRALAGR